MKKLFILILCLSLAGCGMSATKTTTSVAPDGTQKTVSEPGPLLGTGDYDVYGAGYAAHEQSKAQQTSAIMSAPSGASTPEARAYEGAMRVMAVAMVSQQKFEMTKPTTAMDAVHSLVGNLPIIGAVGVMGSIANTGIKAAGSKFGDNANVTNSLNRSDSSALNTSSGAATSTATGYTPPVIANSTTDKTTTTQTVQAVNQQSVQVVNPVVVDKQVLVPQQVVNPVIVNPVVVQPSYPPIVTP